MLSSVANIARILRSFHLACPELSLTELSRSLDIPKTTMLKLLHTMRAEGFLEKDPQTGKYRPGQRTLSMSYAILSQSHLARTALPFLQSLVQQTGLVAHLTRYERGEAVWITKVDSPWHPALYSRVGRRVPAYAPASGKAILAFLDADELGWVLASDWKPLTSKTQTDKRVFSAELLGIQKAGYSLQREEVEEGIASVGGPLLNDRGQAIASISLAGPVQRFNAVSVRELGTLVKKTAHEIAHCVSCSS